MEKKEKKLCGAKTRKGGTCKNPAMPNGRCRMHGGTSPGAKKGNKYSLKHGLYSDGLLDGEENIFNAVEFGTLDNEIKMARVMLARAHAAQATYLKQAKHRPEDDPHGMELGQVNDVDYNTGTKEGKKDKKDKTFKIVERTVHRRKKDFSEEIRKWTKTVSDLELKRKQLLETGELDDDIDWTQVGKDVAAGIKGRFINKPKDE